MTAPKDAPHNPKNPAEELDERILRIAAAIGRHLATEELARRSRAASSPEIGDLPLEGGDS